MGKKKNNNKTKNQNTISTPEDIAAFKIQKAWRFSMFKKKVKSKKKKIFFS